MSIPPSGLSTPPPLLEAFNELFTSRLNIDKFCVNLNQMKNCMLEITLLSQTLQKCSETIDECRWSQMADRMELNYTLKMFAVVWWKLTWCPCGVLGAFDWWWLPGSGCHSPSQDYTHPDDHTSPTYNMTAVFKPFTVRVRFSVISKVPDKVVSTVSTER